MTKPQQQPTATLDPDSVELKQGEYWRALKTFGPHIQKGNLHLLKSIRTAEGRVHTLVLHPHPSTPIYDDVRFLVDDFLKYFEPVEAAEANRIRTSEVGAIQKRLLELQREVMGAQTEPEVMRGYLSDGIRAWEATEGLAEGSTSNLPLVDARSLVPSPGLRHADVARMGLAAKRTAEEAKLAAAWITDRSNQISTMAKSMTPYFQETAAAALSRTEEITHVVKRITQGVENLMLYVGDDVRIRPLKQGASAPPDEKLTIRQRKLFMDEEMSAWADVDETFDFESIPKFLEVLRTNNHLVEQIFPSPRSVVCVAATRRIDKEYVKRGRSAFDATAREFENRKVFLLVRDGENLFEVLSPVETHLTSDRLFPSHQEIEEIFKRDRWNWNQDEFGGKYVAEEITYQDTEYTDRLDQHNELALHYRRFLMLLAGLDQFHGLFGSFHNAPPATAFVSQAFQAEFLEFLHDDDAAPRSRQLPGKAMPTFREFFKAKNRFLTAGSRVLCEWNLLVNPATSPGSTSVYRQSRGYGGEDFHFRVRFREKTSVCVVQARCESLIVKARVSPEPNYNDRPDFDATVNLSAYRVNDYRIGEGMLVLDDCTSQELEFYIHNRSEREDFAYFLRPLKAAYAVLRAEEERQRPARAAMLQALSEGSIASGADADAIVDEAIRTWRALHRGAEIPAAGSTAPEDRAETAKLLIQMWALANQDHLLLEVGAIVERLGLAPLRVTLTGRNSVRIYAAPTSDERDDRLVPHAWVHQIALQRKHRKLVVGDRRWVVLPSVSATETVLREWPEASVWIDRPDFGVTHEEKQGMFEKASAFARDGVPPLFRESLSTELWDEHFEAWKGVRREAMRSRPKRDRDVHNPVYHHPVGVVVAGAEGHSGTKLPKLQYVVVGWAGPDVQMVRLAPDEARRTAFIEAYARAYKAYEVNRAGLDLPPNQPMPALQVGRCDRVVESPIPFSDAALFPGTGRSSLLRGNKDFRGLVDVKNLPELARDSYEVVKTIDPVVWIAPEVIDRIDGEGV